MSIRDAFPQNLMSLSVGVYCARIRTSFIRFVIKVRCFFSALEHSLSTTMITSLHIVPESWGIVMVVKIIQTDIDLLKFRLTDLGLDFENPFQNNLHSFYHLQKYVKFFKI